MDQAVRILFRHMTFIDSSGSTSAGNKLNTVPPQCWLLVKITGQAIHVYRNIEARSHYHVCRRKAISIKYLSVCAPSLSYPACKAHSPCCIVVCGLSDCTGILHHINGKISKKKKILCIRSVS